LQFHPSGFEWVDLNHRQESVVVYKRKGRSSKDELLIVLNLTPVVRYDWIIKLSEPGDWQEILNSDDLQFYGTGDVYNPNICINESHDMILDLPPLGGIILRRSTTFAQEP
jgi:1,4-alpha-glucan branching enzyme